MVLLYVDKSASSVNLTQSLTKHYAQWPPNPTASTPVPIWDLSPPNYDSSECAPSPPSHASDPERHCRERGPTLGGTTSITTNPHCSLRRRGSAGGPIPGGPLAEGDMPSSKVNDEKR